jgi:hypothetical protein
MDEHRPEPLAALHEAAEECGITLPAGLLERVLALEERATEQRLDRAVAQAELRGLIEMQAK